MNFHTLHEAPPEWLGAALERFESQFVYPLGADGSFRISHGRDYLPFFSAMGPATLLVAEEAGEVLGTLARVERRIEFVGSSPPNEQPVHYLADLKVSPQTGKGRVLARLMLAAKEQIERTGFHYCYGIVMNGTARLPFEYTGRLGIPVFEKLAEIMVLRITAAPPLDSGDKAFAAIPPKRDCIVTGGRRELRSLLHPVPMPDSAWLEDTRKGKCLWTSGGVEMISAHLSSFYFDDPERGAAVVRAAVQEMTRQSIPALFVAVPLSRYASLRVKLSGLHLTEAPATVFGHGLSRDYDWWVDTSEI